MNFKTITVENQDFVRISKQSKFTSDAKHFILMWHCGVLEGIFEGDKLIGFLWYNIAKRNKYLKLYYLGIDNEYKNKGYGKLAMNRLFEVAKEYGMEKISFKVSKKNEAINFYKKFSPIEIEELEKDYYVTYPLIKNKLCIK